VAAAVVGQNITHISGAPSPLQRLPEGKGLGKLRAENKGDRMVSYLAEGQKKYGLRLCYHLFHDTATRGPDASMPGAVRATVSGSEIQV